MTDREAFEKWAQDSYLLQECGDGRYASEITQSAWEGWQAALQAMRGEADTKTHVSLCQEGYVPVPRAAVTEVLRISDRQHPAWDAVKAALLSAGKEK
jgi:hypothetical protein